MTAKSRNKGKSWEREAAKFLSDLYCKSFVRVVNSGAFVGGIIGIDLMQKQKVMVILVGI